MSHSQKTVRRYSSAGGIVVWGDQVLLLDRPSRGEVRLPKGHIDPGEEAVEAALRETAEESGYADLEILANLGSHTVHFIFEGIAYSREEHYFLMRLQSERQIPRSPQDTAQFQVLWVPLEGSPEQLTYEAEQTALRDGIAAYHSLSR